MKKLNNRYKRGFIHNFSFYAGIFFLTCITALMYLLFSTSVICEDKYVHDLFRINNVEDGQFTTLKEMTDDDLSAIEEEYGVKLERQTYCSFEEDDYTVRVFGFTEKVNIPEVTKGSAPEEDDEICLSQSFAEANDIAVGGEIELGGRSYTVTGFAERPDYLYMIENQSDSFHRASEFGIAFVTDGEMESFGDRQFYYSITYGDNGQDDVRKYIYDEFHTLSYMSSDTNHRISTPKATIIQYSLITGGILPALLLLVIAIIAVVLGRKVRSEKKHIGTLSALGYRKSEISLHYVWYALIPGILGEAAGIILTYIFVDMAAGEFFFKLEKLPVKYTISPVNVAIVLVVPVAAYAVTSLLTAGRILKMNVTDMLSGRSTRGRESRLLVESGVNFRTKFRLRSLLNNYGRTIVVILGIVVSGLIMAMALMMDDSCKNYEKNVIDDIGSFNYEYILSYPMNDDEQEGEKLLSNTFEVTGSENSIMLTGVYGEGSMINLETTDGGTADLDGKYYISSMASAIFGVGKGDVLTVYDPCSLEEYDITVSGVINNRAQSMMISSAETVADLIGIDEGYYNIVMSEEELDIDSSVTAEVIEKKAMKEMIQNVISGMKALIWLMVIFGTVICAISVYLMVNMLIEENAVTISMLKVLGYHSREIDRITTNIYHILVPFGIVLALGGGWLITWMYFDFSTASFQAQIPVYLSAKGFVIFIAAIVLSYAVSLVLLSRKVKNINMSDSLKSARE
ncbi:MAG: FtsX-like permease family protein [Ruminococcus sp.]|nr:FtsX-like permease family protein [Ruminococcus sp.]